MCVIPAGESIRRVSPDYSNPFTPTSPAVSVWDSRSAAPSSRPTEDNCGRCRTNLTAPYSALPCRSREDQVPMIEDDPTVFVVDDDVAVRDAITGVMKSVGLRAETFASTQDFLRRG